ncbi:hypothetical protein AGMMS49928_06810 [Spirochaetia bacterium]|nr:hypothetical protein AGMMS49928_06810 [Spirochaetia bacterium]
MSKTSPILIWELTRAASSIAAWWVLFYWMHRPAGGVFPAGAVWQ